MKQFQGISASSGVAIGKVLLLKGTGITVQRLEVHDEELERQLLNFEKAIEKTRQELAALKNKVKNTIGIEESAIFDAHMLLLNDPNLIEKSIKKARQELVSIDFAFNEVLTGLIKVFESMDDVYLRERANDLLDVGKRVLKNYLGIQTAPVIEKEHDVILIAHTISPSDMAEIDKTMIKGIITEVGGTTSHVAIMARSLDIPAVVGVEGIFGTATPDSIVIIDAHSGLVIVNPDDATVQRYKEQRARYINYTKSLERLRSEEAITKDGKRIRLELNMELVKEADLVNQYGADGIGLFRTEYLFMRETLPTEDEQFELYKYVSNLVYPREVVIRTADIGGDKFISHFQLPKEMNPFLGMRGIRLCLEYKDFFKTQLRAILRASKLKNLKIMFPMITSVEELRKAKEVVEEAKDELRDRGVAFDETIDIGIMMEVPSAAIISDILAKESDFFSIGTNDLIQYTLAVDRVNERVSYLYNPFNPAILRLLKMIINNAHNRKIDVTMCGEMAGKTEFTMMLIGFDLDCFSVAPGRLLEIKKIIREIEYSKCKELVAKSIHYEDERSIEDYFMTQNRQALQSILYNYSQEGDGNG